MSLEKAHYNLGIVYAGERKLDKAIIEFNKTMKINHNYAMLSKSALNTLSEDKKAISDKRIHSSKLHSGENVYDNANSKVEKESLHKEEQVKESLQNQIPHKTDVAEEMILAKKSNTKNVEDIQKHAENQYPFLLARGNDSRKLAQSDKMPSDTRQLQGTNILKPEKILLKKKPYKEGRDEKQIKENMAYKQTAIKQETDASRSNNQSKVGFSIQAKPLKAKAVATNKTSSDYRVYTYNITRNYNNKIEVNEAIKKYEDDTIKNPYDNNAILNLAHAYYRKAMYLDDAIARREDAPKDNQTFSVKTLLSLGR